MATIAIVTSGLTGLLHSSFEIVARLQEAGHRVVYASPHEVGDRVRQQGFTYVQLPPQAFNPAPIPNDWKGLTRYWKLLRFAAARRTMGRKTLQMEAFRDFLQTSEAALVLVDMELIEHQMTAASLGFPVLQVCNWFCSWKRPGLPPIQSSIIPGDGFAGSLLGIEMAWLRIRLKRWVDIWRNRLKTVFTDRRSVLQSYAREIGFPQQLLQAYNWPLPYTMGKLPAICLSLASLEFPHRWRPNTYYVGPMVYENRVDRSLEPSSQARVERLLLKKQQDGQRLIFGALSTMGSPQDAPFLARLFEAVGAKPEWMLVMGLGGQLQETAFAEVPDNVYLFDWVPQLRFLAEADCAIIHGGINTIGECLHYGLPMLAYSGKKYDQDGNIARLVHHGLAVLGDKAQDSVTTIGTKIDRALNDEQYHVRAAQAHNEYLANRHYIVEIVEQILTRPAQTYY